MPEPLPFSFVRAALKTMPPPTILMTPAQAAAKLGMALTTFEEEVAAGKIGFVTISKPGAVKEHRRYGQVHLDDYVKANTSKEAPKYLSVKSKAHHSTILSLNSAEKDFEALLSAKTKKTPKTMSAK